jgi:hypothetical protein
VHGAYAEILVSLEQGRYPEGVRSRLTELYRELERARDPFAVAEVPSILSRLPDLTPAAMRYLTRIKTDDAEDVGRVLLELTGDDRFHRDQEWLHICRTAQWYQPRPFQALAERLEEVARSHGHALVAARALIAWGALSDEQDFSLADEIWPLTAAAWRPYVLVAIQRKAVAERDDRYLRWSGEERFLRNVADAIRDRPFNWRSL